MFYLFNEIISQFFHVKFPCLWVSFIYAMAESWLKIPTRGIVINPPIRVYIGHSKDSHSFMMTIAHDLSSYHTISCCWLSHPNYTHDVPIFWYIHKIYIYYIPLAIRYTSIRYPFSYTYHMHPIRYPIPRQRRLLLCRLQEPHRFPAGAGSRTWVHGKWWFLAGKSMEDQGKPQEHREII